MAETLSTLSIISFAAAGVFLVLAIFLWFFMKIPSVIGYFSGKTARKSIEKMRESNEKSGPIGYMAGRSGAMPVKMAGTAPRQVPPAQKSGPARPAAKAPDASQASGTPASRMPGTVPLKQNWGTDYAAPAETTPLDSTTVLKDDKATTLLGAEKEQSTKRSGGVKLTMKDEVMMIHTDEVIE